jgi:hypothetical protein
MGERFGRTVWENGVRTVWENGVTEGKLRKGYARTHRGDFIPSLPHRGDFIPSHPHRVFTLHNSTREIPW